MDRTPVIVGAANYPLLDGVVQAGVSPLHIQAIAAANALNQAGLSLADVDGIASAGAWHLTGAGQHITMTLGEYFGISPNYVESTNIGGASFEVHAAHAAMALRAGYCDVVLITYGSTQRSDRSRGLAGRTPALNMQFETPTGLLSPVGGYAMAANRYAHQYGDIRGALNDVAVSARRWATLNPEATKRSPLTAEDVERSPLVSDPLRSRDCCLVTDGGGAVVMTTAERARDTDVNPIHITGYAEGQSHWTMTSVNDLTITSASRSGPKALQMAGRDHNSIDVVEIYDSFTITVLLTLESLGFCGVGEASDFLATHDIGPGGNFPLNTNGGGLSYAHPGMYGIFLLTEACRQLWGKAGEAQVPAARSALVCGTGGALSSTGVCILEVE